MNLVVFQKFCIPVFFFLLGASSCRDQIIEVKKPYPVHIKGPGVVLVPRTGLVGAAMCRFKEVVFRGIFGGLKNMYMGVSLNGGTPKTPQNDHF